MVCPSCQKDVIPGSKFCYHCGAKQPEPAPNAPQAPAQKRLVRSTTNKKIAGVCAGLAQYFDLDVTLIRVIWLVLLLCAGTGLIAYIICWIVIPVAPAGYTSPSGVATM